MNALLANDLLLIAVAVLAAAIVAFLIFRPRQSVRLSNDTPLRPHMTSVAKRATKPAPTREGRGLAAEAAAAASDVTGQILGARVHAELPGASGPPDDLERLKGVGPKLAQLLNARGFTRFAQIARLSPHEVERLDMDLGAFRGRLARDRIVEQAHYLARGDEDGFQHRFGRL
ncbi:MAG: hypothetical protein ABIP91_09295 [Sphingomicrobium sp.]